MPRRPLVVIGLLGPTLDDGIGAKRWQRWRPTVSLAQQPDLAIDRIEILHQRAFDQLGEVIAADIRQVSPDTEVRRHHIEFTDAWDFQGVYAALHGFALGYPFAPDQEDYLIHITTGTHVAQICLFLLTESRHLPARLVQTSPGRGGEDKESRIAGAHAIIDLDLSKYDKLAARFAEERRHGVSLLTSGIPTRNADFTVMIQRIERVAAASTAPILLTGATGAGKTLLARRIFELKKARNQVDGAFVEVNCATIRGDGAMSALFGHAKGAFTGAASDRQGLLKRADGGLLFLDEIGELGLDEQAMLLRAIEEKTFLPLGSDKPVLSDFQVIVGTNRDLGAAVAGGSFRDDLLARIDLWSFRLPSLAERREDIEPNLDYELGRFTRDHGRRVAFNREARSRFLAFATSAGALWSGNFRDLAGAVTRLATLAAGGRITEDDVDAEILRLQARWRPSPPANDPVHEVLGAAGADGLDRFDRVQLADVIAVCRSTPSLSEAGRSLFAVTRREKSRVNDADRLAKYLARFGLTWKSLSARSPGAA